MAEATLQNVYAVEGAQPLRTDNSDPLKFLDETDARNEEVYERLVNDFERNAVEGYMQSHPYSHMYTGQSLAVDQITLNNNYMRLIFGGRPDPDRDNIHLAYEHANRQIAEAPTLQEFTLQNMNPNDFVEGEEATKDSLLKTFQEQRQYWKGPMTSDTERALRQRATHGTTHFTFYDKKITNTGAAGRFHLVRGQHGHLQHRPDTSEFFPRENLSSYNYAPMQDGGEIPLDFGLAANPDPRAVPITVQPRTFPETKGVHNFGDAGPYPGHELDRYAADYVEDNPTFTALFRPGNARRFAGSAPKTTS
jgi:hypothetical protein